MAWAKENSGVMDVRTGQADPDDRVDSTRPRYARPGHRPDGTRPENQIERGQYDHGVCDDPAIDKDEPGKVLVQGVSDALCPELPDDDRVDGDLAIVPVRVVPDNRKRIVVEVQRYTVVATSLDVPYRILGEDRKRIRARIGLATNGNSTATTPAVTPTRESSPAYAFSLVGYNFTPGLETVTTEELWVVPPATPTDYSLSVYIERELDADPYPKE